MADTQMEFLHVGFWHFGVMPKDEPDFEVNACVFLCGVPLKDSICTDCREMTLLPRCRDVE